MVYRRTLTIITYRIGLFSMEELFIGFTSISLKEIGMIFVGIVLLTLAIKKEYEPMLLLPIGFGTILVNLPLSAVWSYEGEIGFLQILFNAGIATELFPVLIFIAVGALMFGNLIRECTVLERLSQAAQNELANIVTILLGITIGSSMTAEKFLNWSTLMILAMGLIAFIFDTMGGVFFAKFLSFFRKEKINPMVGAAGISAFPMSARVIQRMATADDPNNFVIMHSVSANVSGQLGSVIAGGIVLALVPILVG